MKNNNDISYGRLESVLKELGFVKKIVPDTGVGYKHPSTGALVVVRLHKPSEIVPDYVMVGVRHELEFQGVIALKEFDEMLQATAA